MILLTLFLLSCSPKVSGVRVHNNKKVYQESKQMTEQQKVVFTMTVFIIVGLILSALDHKEENYGGR